MEVVDIIVTLGKDERCRLTSPTETAIMDVKCFICHGDFKEAVADVKTMNCCKQTLHKMCHDRWALERHYCAMCRRPLCAIEPLTHVGFERITTAKYLLNREDICSWTAFIEGAGLLVEDEELRSALKKYLGDAYCCIQRVGPRLGGFEPGRLVAVVFTNTAGADFCINIERRSGDYLIGTLPVAFPIVWKMHGLLNVS